MNSPADLIQQSFESISQRSDALTEAFYRNLFADFPDAKRLFTDVDMVHQRRKLWAMLTLIATDMNRMDLLVPVLRELGARHVHYKVDEALYPCFTATFCKSLRETVGDRLSADALDAWEDGLGQICQHMIQGAASKASSEPVATPHSDDLAMLMEISGQPKISSASTRLYTSFLEKKRHDYEMEVARSVQQALLPETMPMIGEYEFFASYVSALKVGGDYYDYLILDNDRICLSFGDVSGKGVPGALIMSRLASAVQCTVPLADDAGKAIEVINNHMCRRTGCGRFVTFILLIVDLKNNSLSLVNAGHRPPMIRGLNGSLEECGSEVVGLPLGIIHDLEHEVFERRIRPGETLVMFTDGIDEAMNAKGQKYGMPRLRDFLKTAPPKPAELSRALLSDVKAHAQGHPQQDDMTVLAMARQS